MTDSESELAETLAKVQYHHNQAVAELAQDDRAMCKYHLGEAYEVLQRHSRRLDSE